MKKLCSLLLVCGYFFLQACSPGRFMENTAQQDLLGNKDLQQAHIGISIYDASAGIFLYNHQADKFFTPASNTKLFSLYAGLKYLGDSLVGIKYLQRDGDILLLPAGDPTLLHPDFIRQPVIDFLKKIKGNIYVTDANWQDRALGAGWSWDDYNDDYMAERSLLPVYGNVIRWVEDAPKDQKQTPPFDASPSIYSIPEVDWKVRFTTDTLRKVFFVQRNLAENVFEITQGPEKHKTQDVPFVTEGLMSALSLLKDTIGKTISTIKGLPAARPRLNVIHSQPVDSMYRPMMHRSDNFFAEQTLMMVSNERLGVMNDEKIIDTLLKSDLKDLPQKPAWADGSGLSRLNLFTPQDFVWLLNKMKDEFGLDRMERILPTGGRGTLSNRYKQDSGFIFAKTGSLSGVVSLSGYLITSKNKLLIFSVLINNHHGSAAEARNATEKFITAIRRKY